MRMADDKVPVIGGLHHIALRASDYARSLWFYTAGLGFRLALEFPEDGRMVALLDTGSGVYVELYGGADALPTGALFHFALRTADCVAAVAQARAAGARITTEATAALLGSDPPVHVRYAFCEGPDGEQIEFLESTAI